jgi:hypothetical protein
MNKITLNAREIQKIYDLFNKMNESTDFGTIELEQSESTGILTATMTVTHREVEGEFTVTISDEMEW